MSLPIRRSALQQIAGLAACTALLCSCSGGSGDSPTSQTTSDISASPLGAVPIPQAPKAEPTPVASLQHPQLLAIGQPVKIEVAGASALVTAFGPRELTPYRGGPTVPTSTVGIITIVAQPTSGNLALNASDFLSRDETGHIVSLAPAGRAHAMASGSTTSIRVKGTFESGAAQLTWRYHGRVLAIWDFNIELD